MPLPSASIVFPITLLAGFPLVMLHAQQLAVPRFVFLAISSASLASAIIRLQLQRAQKKAGPFQIHTRGPEKPQNE